MRAPGGGVAATGAAANGESLSGDARSPVPAKAGAGSQALPLAQRLTAPIRRRVRDFIKARLQERLDRVRIQLDLIVEDPSRVAAWPASRDQDWIVPHLLKTLYAERGQATPSYLARRKICEMPGWSLQRSDQERCRRRAEEMGIPLGMPLVILHVRDHGFKQDPVNRDAEGKILKRAEFTRNADITTYFPAIDHLVSRGFAVIRTGDASMPAVERPGVFDLATHPGRDGLLELYLLSVARFMVASESGPYHVAYMFGLPTLLINGTDVLGSYPIRPTDRYIFKRVRNLETGELLPLPDLIGEKHYMLFRNTDYFEYVDNSPDDIFRAVKEMLRVLDGDVTATELQTRFRDMLVDSASALAKQIYYVRKWGADHGFLGHGYICNSFAKDVLASHSEFAPGAGVATAKAAPPPAEGALSIQGG